MVVAPNPSTPFRTFFAQYPDEIAGLFLGVVTSSPPLQKRYPIQIFNIRSLSVLDFDVRIISCRMILQSTLLRQQEESTPLCGKRVLRLYASRVLRTRTVPSREIS